MAGPTNGLQQSPLPLNSDQTTPDPSELNVISPDGSPGTVPKPQIQQALNEGYRLETPEESQARVLQSKYGSPEQQAKALVEGAGKGLLGPIATSLEVGAGVDPESIKGRAAANPTTHAIGEVGTLVGGALLGTGEGALLNEAGELGIKALGAGKIGELTEAGKIIPKEVGIGGGVSTLSKIGSSAARLAIENGLYQSGDELSKTILGDPTSVESAAANIGLAGLIGAGTGILGKGIVAPLWEATVGDKLTKTLQSITNRVNGTPVALPEAMDQAISQSGVDVPQIMRAALSGNQSAMDTFNILREQQHPEILEAIENLKQQTANNTMRALGKTPEEVANYSPANQGRDAMTVFKSEFENKYKPISEEYDSITEPFKEIELNPRKTFDVQTDETINNPYLIPRYRPITSAGDIDTIAEKIQNMAQEKGYLTPGLPQSELVQKTMNALPEMKTVQDLANLSSNIGKAAYSDAATRDVGRELTHILTEGQNDAIQRAIGEKAPELMDRYAGVRKQYSDLSKMTREMSANLGIGTPGGPKDFLTRLEAKRSPEEFLRALSPKGNAELIPFMEKHFPDTLEKIRENELFNLVKPAVRTAEKGLPINLKTLNAGIDKMTPEMREFIFGAARKGGDPHESAKLTLEAINNVKQQYAAAEAAGDKLKAHELMGNITALESSLVTDVDRLINPKGFVQQGALNKIRAAKTLLDAIPSFKSSGTAGWQSKLNKHVLGGASAVISSLMGHNPGIGFILGELGQYVAKDAPNAIRLAMLKFMGSEAPLSAPGFAAAAGMFKAIEKGAKLSNKAVAALFKPGQEVLNSHMLASKDDREKLNKQISEIAMNPAPLMKAQDHLAHYAPEHAGAVSTVSSNAISYLNNLRPGSTLGGLEDKEAPLSAEKQNEYNRALDIAHQPLSILQNIKDGTLTAKDVVHARTMYPNLMNDLSQKIVQEVINVKSNGDKVPYKTKIGLSLFLGEPLDGTLRPSAIALAQPTPPMQQPQTPTQPASNPKRSMTALNKLPQSYQTPSQSRQSQKTKIS